MSHAAVYRARPDAQCVIHFHNKAIFEKMLELKKPATPPDAEFGTPAMALAIQVLAPKLGPSGSIVMAGHQDGVICWGRSVSEAMQAVLETVKLGS
jgi:ribulose-5-phosphate 4-epimerase/fuculose-1-phosphate aldolase